MKENEFNELLFKVAFCTVACDGHIDEREIAELKLMDESASFFNSIDLSEELSGLVSDFDDKGVEVIADLFDALRDTDLNSIQELLVLEVSLRIINADERHDENEIKFISLLRSKLNLHDETIRDRFGVIDILSMGEYSNIKNISQSHDELINTIDLPAISDLKLIDLDT